MGSIELMKILTIERYKEMKFSITITIFDKQYSQIKSLAIAFTRAMITQFIDNDTLEVGATGNT